MTLLKIQPGPADGYDSYIDEQNPSTNYQSATSLFIKGPSNNRKQALIQFPLGQLPVGATITKAELAVYVVAQSDAKNLYCHEVTQAWYLDTVDWDERPVPGSVRIEGEANAGQWTKFNVMTMLQEWIAYPEYNLGVQLLSDLCNDSDIEIYSADYLGDASKRPYLEITYTMGGLVASDTWLDYDRYIDGAGPITWTYGKYRFLTPKSIEIAIKGTFYNPPTDIFRLRIPTGLTMDSGKFNVGGAGLGYDATAGYLEGCVMANDGANRLLFISEGFWTPSNPFTWASGDEISANCIIPIV